MITASAPPNAATKAKRPRGRPRKVSPANTISHTGQARPPAPKQFRFVEGTDPSGRILQSNLSQIRSHAARGRRRYLTNGQHKAPVELAATCAADQHPEAGRDPLLDELAISEALLSPQVLQMQSLIGVSHAPYNPSVEHFDRYLSALLSTRSEQSTEPEDHASNQFQYCLKRAHCMRDLICDPFLRPTILSLLAGRSDIWTILRGSELVPSSVSLDLVRTRVEHQVDAESLLALVCLCRIEWRSERYDNAAIHLNILKAIVEANGGLQSFDDAVSDIMMVMDNHLAVSTLRHPVLIADDPGDVADTWQLNLGGRGINHGHLLGRNLLYELNRWKCSDALLDYVLEIKRCGLIAVAYYQGNQPEESRRAQRRWLLLKGNWVLHELLSISFRSETELFTPLNIIRIALVMWIVHATMHRDSPKFNTTALLGLQSALKASMNQSDESKSLKPQTMMWVAATASNLCTSPALRQGYIDIVLELVVRLGLSSLAECKEVLMGYFFIDELLADVLNDLEQYFQLAFVL